MQTRTILSAFRPGLRLSSSRHALLRPVIAAPTSAPLTAPFTSSAPQHAKKEKRENKRDSRVSAIRYHLQHPATPRPLRFSRLRALRHWTIHRAWQLFKAKERRAQEVDLQRQYNSMRDACERLRLMDDRGMPGAEGDKAVGRLYRRAMMKDGVWEGVPIEYARAQTDFPSRDGWNYGWTR